MNDKNLISIIVPIYNVEKYLKRCIDSIINQTYKKLEIILVDDGSKDNSGKICDKYAKKDIRIKVIHKKNEGVSEARNVGLKVSTGEYIGFVDADDYIEPNMYEEMSDNLKENNADIVICDYNTNDREKQRKTKQEKNHKYTNNIEIISKDEACNKLFFDYSCRGFLWNKLYKRDILCNAGKIILFDKNIKILEDLVYNYIIFQNANKIVYNHHPFYNYIQREDSVLNSGYSMANMTSRMALGKLIKIVKNEKIRDNLKREYLREISCICAYLAKNNLMDQETIDKLKKEKKKYKAEILNSKYLTISQKIKTTMWYYFPKILYNIYKLNR